MIAPMLACPTILPSIQGSEGKISGCNLRCHLQEYCSAYQAVYLVVKDSHDQTNIYVDQRSDMLLNE